MHFKYAGTPPIHLLTYACKFSCISFAIQLALFEELLQSLLRLR